MGPGMEIALTIFIIRQSQLCCEADTESQRVSSGDSQAAIRDGMEEI